MERIIECVPNFSEGRNMEVIDSIVSAIEKSGGVKILDVLEIDEKTGKMRLSRKALIEKPEGYVEPERRPRGGDRGPRRDNDRRDNRGPRRDDNRGPRRDDRDPRGPRRERPVENNDQNNEPEMF